MDKVYDSLGIRKGPTNLTADPIKSDWLIITVLSGELKIHHESLICVERVENFIYYFDTLRNIEQTNGNFLLIGAQQNVYRALKGKGTC